MKLLWCDIETTGLQPDKDLILEVCVREATLEAPFTSKPLYHAVFAVYTTTERGYERLTEKTALPKMAENGLGVSQLVIDMHTKNGLWQACSESLKLVEDADRALSGLVPEEADKDLRPILAGSTIHFDKSFLRVWMPQFHARLSHRLYDVSAIKLFCQSLGMPKIPKGEAHRAEADVLESIDHAERCVNWLASEW